MRRSLARGLSSLPFSALGSIASGAMLTIVDWSAATSPGYAIRFLGDASSSAAFLMLLGQTTINGLAD